jgi:hypothetical protein
MTRGVFSFYDDVDGLILSYTADVVVEGIGGEIAIVVGGHRGDFFRFDKAEARELRDAIAATISSGKEVTISSGFWRWTPKSEGAVSGSGYSRFTAHLDGGDGLRIETLGEPGMGLVVPVRSAKRILADVSAAMAAD